MNKKVKWGLIAFIACGLVVWGVYSQLPKLNSELAQADKVESGDKAKKNILNVNALKVRTGVLTDEFTVSGNLLPDEEVDLSFETSRRDWVQRRKPRHQRPITCQGKRQAITGRIETLASPTQTGQ